MSAGVNDWKTENRAVEAVEATAICTRAAAAGQFQISLDQVHVAPVPIGPGTASRSSIKGMRDGDRFEPALPGETPRERRMRISWTVALFFFWRFFD